MSICELKIAVKAEGTSRKIKTLAAHMSRVVDSYAELLRNKSKATNSLVDIIKQALFSVEYRLNAHEIEIIDEFSEYKGNVDVKCASNMIVGAIIISLTIFNPRPRPFVFVVTNGFIASSPDILNPIPLSAITIPITPSISSVILNNILRSGFFAYVVQ